MRLRSYSPWFAVVAAVAVVVVGLALVVPTAMRSGSAHAQTTAVSTTVAPRAPAASSTPCNFQDAQTCQSTDPTVTVSTYQSGDTSACTFDWNVDWGDGQSSPFELVNPPDGWVVLGQHPYAAPGTYTIAFTGHTKAGNCTASDFTRTFTLPGGKVHRAPQGAISHWVRQLEDRLVPQCSANSQHLAECQKARQAVLDKLHIYVATTLVCWKLPVVNEDVCSWAADLLGISKDQQLEKTLEQFEQLAKD